MITYENALEIAENRVKNIFTSKRELTIIKEATITKSYGWIFFYNSKEFLETGNYSVSLVGNAPFLVDLNGKIHVTGTAYPIEHYISLFDEEFDK